MMMWLAAAALMPSQAGASGIGGNATVTLSATVLRQATITLAPTAAPLALAMPRVSSNAVYSRVAEVDWTAQRPTLLVSVILN
jgi:hypothetical protein